MQNLTHAELSLLSECIALAFQVASIGATEHTARLFALEALRDRLEEIRTQRLLDEK